MQPQFNHNALRAESPDARDPAKVLEWLNKQFSRINSVMRGPHTFAATVVAGAVAIQPALADLTTLTLIANTTITLPTDQVRAGTEGTTEVLQNGTGGWTVTWVNALWAASTPPVVAAGANKRTMIRHMYNGSGWVGTVMATNY